ncbi:MAG: hypothetical protein ACYSUH_09625 [Planctomycetota bacterium]
MHHLERGDGQVADGEGFGLEGHDIQVAEAVAVVVLVAQLIVTPGRIVEYGRQRSARPFHRTQAAVDQNPG